MVHKRLVSFVISPRSVCKCFNGSKQQQQIRNQIESHKMNAKHNGRKNVFRC